MKRCWFTLQSLFDTMSRNCLLMHNMSKAFNQKTGLQFKKKTKKNFNEKRTAEIDKVNVKQWQNIKELHVQSNMVILSRYMFASHPIGKQYKFSITRVSFSCVISLP